MMVYIGIIRAGGDTRFAFIAELCTMWLYGVPAAWIGANLFYLPIYWVVPIALSEEVLKSFIAFARYRSKKWVHHLAHSIVE
jgi:Na+-driven multidrug efflux pump